MGLVVVVLVGVGVVSSDIGKGKTQIKGKMELQSRPISRPRGSKFGFADDASF